MCNLKKILIKKFIREKGGYFGLLGVLSNSISVIVAYLLYSQVNPSFNTISYAVSDLGTGPNMSNVVYNIGAIVTGFSLVFLHLSLISFLHDRKPDSHIIKITKLVALISAIGLIILGIVPFKRDKPFFFIGHGSTTATHYVAGSIAFICYGFLEIFILKFSKVLGILSFSTGFIYGSLWIGYVLDYLFKIPRAYVNYTLQWINLAGILLWLLVHSTFLIKIKRKSGRFDE